VPTVLLEVVDGLLGTCLETVSDAYQAKKAAFMGYKQDGVSLSGLFGGQRSPGFFQHDSFRLQVVLFSDQGFFSLNDTTETCTDSDVEGCRFC